MSRQLNKSRKAAADSENELIESDVMAGRQDLYGARQMARSMRRDAKRRRARALRRQARQLCDIDDVDAIDDLDYNY